MRAGGSNGVIWAVNEVAWLDALLGCGEDGSEVFIRPRTESGAAERGKHHSSYDQLQSDCAREDPKLKPGLESGLVASAGLATVGDPPGAAAEAVSVSY